MNIISRTRDELLQNRAPNKFAFPFRIDYPYIVVASRICMKRRYVSMDIVIRR